MTVPLTEIRTTQKDVPGQEPAEGTPPEKVFDVCIAVGGVVVFTARYGTVGRAALDHIADRLPPVSDPTVRGVADDKADAQGKACRLYGQRLRDLLGSVHAPSPGPAVSIRVDETESTPIDEPVVMSRQEAAQALASLADGHIDNADVYQENRDRRAEARRRALLRVDPADHWQRSRIDQAWTVMGGDR